MYIFHNINSNNIYLLFASIIVFIIVYISFFDRKHEDDANIIIEIGNNYLDMKYEDVDEHLYTLQDHLSILSKNFDINQYDKIKSYLHDAEKDLYNFTKIKNNTTLTDIIGVEAEKKMYCNDLDDDLDDKPDDNFKLRIENLIKSIKLTRDMLKPRSKMRIKLSNIHKLLKEMNNMAKIKVMVNYDDDLMEKSVTYEIYNTDNTYMRKFGNNATTAKFAEKSHTVGGSYEEDTVNDSENISRKVNFVDKIVKINKINKQDLTSQDLEQSCGNILANRKTPKYIQYCDINKLKQEHVGKKNLMTDLKFNRSLRNDYSHLDE